MSMDFCVHVYLYMGQYMYIHMCVCVHPRCSSCRRMGCYVILHGHQHVISPAYTHNITNMIRWESTTLTPMQTSTLLRGYFLMGLSVDAGMSFTNSEAKDALARQAHRFVCRVSASGSFGLFRETQVWGFGPCMVREGSTSWDSTWVQICCCENYPCSAACETHALQAEWEYMSQFKLPQACSIADYTGNNRWT